MADAVPDQSAHNDLFAVFQNSPVAVAVIRHGAVVDVNDAFTRLTGWAREELTGRTARDVGLISTVDAVALL